MGVRSTRRDSALGTPCTVLVMTGVQESE